jgi:hypothetical protein
LLVCMREASRHRRTLSALPLLSWRKLAALLSFFLSFFATTLSLHAPRRIVQFVIVVFVVASPLKLCLESAFASLAFPVCFSRLVQPNAIAHTMMRTLRKISGTIVSLALACCLFDVSNCSWDVGRHSLRISVRTEFMRLIVFALTLAPSCAPPPKEGSFCAALPQPTVLCDC